jgi:anthranilate synthase component I
VAADFHRPDLGQPAPPSHEHPAAVRRLRRRLRAEGQAQVVSTKLVSDLETPVSVMLKLARNSAYGFLLESVEGGAVRGRYSMIGLKPDLIWRVEGAKGRDQPQGAGRSRRPVRAPRREPLKALRDADRGIAHRGGRGPAAHGGRPVRLYRLRHGAPDGALPAVNPDPLGLPDAVWCARRSWPSSTRSRTR